MSRRIIIEESEYCDRLGLIYRGEIIASGRPAELKSRHMVDVVLEIECERPADAMGAIERLPAIKEVALFGDGLHAVAADEAAARTAILAALAEAGIPVRRIERIPPTLEDVFVSLVEVRDRADGTQTEVRR